MSLGAGLHLGVPDYEYHADPADSPSLSSGVANLLLQRSPLHAFAAHPRLGQPAPKESSAFDIGTAAHKLFLEGVDAIVEVQATSWRTKEAQIARDEARVAGKVPLLPEQALRVREMVGALKSRLASLPAKEQPSGDAEVTLLWQDKGVWCRARPDLLEHSMDRFTIWDYKTSGDVSLPRWGRNVFGLGFDLQAALYCRGAAALGFSPVRHRWIAQEIEPPYAVAIYELSPEGMDLARRKAERAISTWAECLSSGEWPSYPLHPQEIEPPVWELAAQETRELMDEEASRAYLDAMRPL